MSTEADPLVWGVDMGWSKYRANSDGHMFASDHRKYHVDRGDTTAKCSRRILLNSMTGVAQRPGYSGGQMYDDMPAGRASEMSRDEVCRRCLPVMPQSNVQEPRP